MQQEIIFDYPKSRPDESPKELWELQCKLDAYAQALFGPRNPEKKLYQPILVADGPHVRNTPDMKGGYAELRSSNAADDWPMTIYQLAHETVHLLDPRPGPPTGAGANWLEEGIAVNFSLAVSQSIGDPDIKVSNKKYKIANQLFCRLQGDLFFKAKQIREHCGHFSDATEGDITAIVPNIHRHIAKRLTTRFFDKLMPSLL